VSAAVERFELRHGRGTTRHWAGRGALDQAAAALAADLEGRTLFAVSTPRVLELHGGALERLAAGAAVLHRLEVPEGEAAKSLEVASGLWRRLSALGGKRDSRLVAFGGGSVGDLGGFVAGAFLRGIGVLQLPTTLLAQVDASIGGKTAVDLPEAKNVVGLFHQPIAVVAETAWLTTLPAGELRSGLVEAIKAGMALDPSLFERIERELPRLAAGDPEALAPVVSAAARAKAGVVERDPEEAGEREVLNLGHTLGHALESASGYGRLLHGDAVAHGLRFALRLAATRGLDAGFGARCLRLLDRLGVPPLAPLAVDDLLARLARDKKARERGLGWVLPIAPGQVRRGVVVAGEELLREVRRFLEEATAR